LGSCGSGCTNGKSLRAIETLIDTPVSGLIKRVALMVRA